MLSKRYLSKKLKIFFLITQFLPVTFARTFHEYQWLHLITSSVYQNCIVIFIFHFMPKLLPSVATFSDTLYQCLLWICRFQTTWQLQHTDVTVSREPESTYCKHQMSIIWVDTSTKYPMLQQNIKLNYEVWYTITINQNFGIFQLNFLSVKILIKSESRPSFAQLCDKFLPTLTSDKEHQ